MKLLGVFLIVVLAIGSSVPAHADGTPPASLMEVLDECSAMGLAAEGARVKDKTVKIGHLEVGFADGTVVPILGKSGSILGVYFEGRGGYLYTTDDVADREAMSVNVSRIANALRPVAGRVSDEFKSALVLFSEPQFADLHARAEGSEAAPAGPLTSGFRVALAGALSTYGEFDFRLAQARMNGRGRWTYVEVNGGLEHVGYVFDDVLSGYERLFGFRKLVDYNVRFSETLSYQPIPGWDRTRKLAVVLTHADVVLATDDNKNGSIDSDITLRVHAPGTRLITLSLLNNRDPDSADWNSPRQKLTLKRLLDADGKELPFSHKYGEVAIEIPPTPAADTDVRLRFETAGEVFVDMGGRHTDNYFSMQGDAWYPSPTGWAGEQFTYTVKVKVKKPWRPVVSGKETSLKDDGDFRIAESRSDHPSMQIVVMAGKYFTRAETIDGFTVRVHSYAWNRKDVLDNMPKLAATFVKLYSGLLGPIPADELDIVEVPSYGWGIAPSGMVLITSEAYTNVAAKFASGINGRLAHEIAHQWFGHKAIPVEANDNWLAESFAEYFAGIAMGVVAAKEKSLHGFDEMLTEWRAENKNCVTGGTIATANYLGGEHGPEDRYCLLYNRGPLVLHMLRTSIGNDRFFSATKKFLDTANDGPASTDDYAKAVSDTVQMDMRWYFVQWVRRSGIAQVDVEAHVDAASSGQFRLWGTITQAAGDGFKKLLVPLVWDNGGKPEARVVFADQPDKKFEFLLPTKPGTIKPDPFQNNLAVYK